MATRAAALPLTRGVGDTNTPAAPETVPPQTAPHARTDAPARSRHAGPVYAALDLGTNNCRLLLGVPNGGEVRVVGSFSRIVRLGEGLANTGRLTDSAIERTLAALHVCVRRIEKAGALHIRCIATEACRRATNGAAFLKRTHRETGLRLEPISTEEEAHLTLSGCRGLIEPGQRHVLLFDIGGGSTEVIWAAVNDQQISIKGIISLPLGVVTLAETFGGMTLSEETFATIANDVDRRLADFDATHRIADHVAGGDVQMIGTSGTVTTLGAFSLGLRHYQRARVDGLSITFEQIEAASAHLKAMGGAARADHPCIGPERADLVLGGCAVLDAICRRWPAGRLRIADRGIREGLLYALMAANGHQPNAPAPA